MKGYLWCTQKRTRDNNFRKSSTSNLRHSNHIGTLALLVLMVGLSACGAGQTSRQAKSSHPPTVSPTPTPPVLPAFSDWRAAYYGRDNRLHAVTLDGATDVAGPPLPALTSPDLSFVSAGMSPDGHTLAYSTVGTQIVSVTTGIPLITPGNDASGASYYALHWSIDGSMLEMGDSRSGIYIWHAGSGAVTQIPGVGSPTSTADKELGDTIGWIDDTHLAMTILVNGPTYDSGDGNKWPLSIGLGSLDINTGAWRLIATFTSPGMGQPVFFVSPAGRYVLFHNSGLRSNPYISLMDEIDTATGQVTPLPQIAHAIGLGFYSVAWRPGTQTVAVSTDATVNGGSPHIWLLDLGQDRATVMLNSGLFVQSWAPNNGPLIVSSLLTPEIDGGAYDFRAVTIGANGQATTTLLTHNAIDFPFVGFVRTA